MAEWLAGYGEEIITPPLGVELSGYGFYLDRRARSVLDDLKARAVWLEKDGSRLLLISCDLVGFSIEHAASIRRTVGASAGVPAERVLLACTHTHTGPATMSLPGLGEVDPGYMETLPGSIARAAARAAADAQAAEILHSKEILEPIGFNRRLNSFEGIDPALGIAYLNRKAGTILVLNYACHPVILGRSTQVSADWPGASVRALETEGFKAIVLQGFCGDIDPVTGLNRWGEGSPEDLELYGRIVAGRALKSARYAKVPGEGGLKVAEKKIRIPLSVCPKDKIGEEAEFFLSKNSGFPLADRFAEEWKKSAAESHERYANNPWLEGVPIQAVNAGGLKIIGLPGEIFTLFGAKLRRGRPTLLTVGYANGDIGYIPGREAFADAGDYACYCAPKFYVGFPFTSDVEDIVTEAGLAALEAVD